MPSLTTLPIVRSNLEERLGAGEVARFARGSDSAVSDAIAQAWDAARSAALNVFTAASWDAMTAATLPWEAMRHIVSDACDLLSKASGRPDFVEKAADEARQWRSWLAADKVRCFDGLLVKIGAAAGADLVRLAAPPRSVFDPTDPLGPMRLRDRPI